MFAPLSHLLKYMVKPLVVMSMTRTNRPRDLFEDIREGPIFGRSRNARDFVQNELCSIRVKFQWELHTDDKLLTDYTVRDSNQVSLLGRERAGP